MLQRWLIFLLVVEVVAYAVLARALSAHGWSGFAIFIFILLTAFLWRLSHALGSFIVCGAMRLADGRRDAGMLNALVGEFTARLLSFNVSQPFVQLAMRDEPVPAASASAARSARHGEYTDMASPPILLVHGYFSNRGMWMRFRQRLLLWSTNMAQAAKAEKGKRNFGPIYTITLEPPFAEIESLAKQLHTRIEAICAETNQPQLIIIAHSMGGLVTRACMVRHGSHRIAAFVTLGSPHRGTRTALMGVGACVKQMRWDGEWTSALAVNERTLKLPPTLSLYTSNDDLVYPPESSCLEWAENMAVSGVGHVGLLFSADVVERVTKFIQQYQQGVSGKNA